jgi:formylglycine-generating enzyme required for sulfatase activity
MGSPSDERERFGNETQHSVTLTKGFWMGRTEVTQAQWARVAESNPSHFKGDELPVDSLDFEDCQSFISRLNDRVQGGGFRLPTEAEWEYACRAGTTGRYAGDLDATAWYANNSGDKPVDAVTLRKEMGNEYAASIMRNGGRTHPVGTKRPNPWGFCDMQGNVTEWCADWYGAYAESPHTDPAGSSRGGFRVSRGGNWLSSDPNMCRSAIRFMTMPGNPDNHSIPNLGLRLVRSSP